MYESGLLVYGVFTARVGTIRVDVVSTALTAAAPGVAAVIHGHVGHFVPWTAPIITSILSAFAAQRVHELKPHMESSPSPIISHMK